MLPGSDRVPCVNSSTSASQLPLRSGLMVHLTTMKIMGVPSGIDRGTDSAAQAEHRTGSQLVSVATGQPRSYKWRAEAGSQAATLTPAGRKDTPAGLKD